MNIGKDIHEQLRNLHGRLIFRLDMSKCFEIRLTRKAKKDLIRLRDLTEKAMDEILELKKNPRKGHVLSGSLRGARALSFSLKGVSYRTAYVVMENEQVCLVFMIGPHEGFYKKAQRRAKSIKQIRD